MKFIENQIDGLSKKMSSYWDQNQNQIIENGKQLAKICGVAIGINIASELVKGAVPYQPLEDMIEIAESVARPVVAYKLANRWLSGKQHYPWLRIGVKGISVVGGTLDVFNDCKTLLYRIF